MLRTVTPLLALCLASCGGPGPRNPEYSAAEGRGETAEPAGGEDATGAEEIPHGRLPQGVTPLSYRLWMEVVPSRERFRGRADIRVRLDEAQSVIWLHGRDMNVSEAQVLPEGVEPVNATFEQVDEEGVAALRLASPVGPGEVELSLTYDAPFDRQLKGLYRVDTDGESYAFTQFEATSARLAFPCFDEPRFKTPFDLTLAVQPDHEAVANTLVTEERTVGRMKEITFATTERLPTYLVAMAVGPLDIVEHDPIPPNSVRTRPLPFRGVAARGRGERLAYALEHTAALLEYLESYFGVEYPYDKLDIIAVPDFASGAMENAGAITFRETLLLLDPEHAPERQRRSYAYVMAHELAHQWFGNLVTMPWWDDIWLNEAFATWMGNKTIRHVNPEYAADIGMLESVQGAMSADSLVSARQIRQPIESNHDIRNAFDSITYRKGGGVLEMFERFVGEDTFRDGIREYIASHRFGTATADDLLDALSRVAGSDVGTPFRTFLFQPGVPMIETSLVEEGGARGVRVRQSRYLPLGSGGDRAQVWGVPICVRARTGGSSPTETCQLVSEREATIPIEGDRLDWYMPNANAAGYFRWSMDADSLGRLQRGMRQLNERERLSLANNVRAAFSAGTIDSAAAFGALEPLAADESRHVATEPMGLLRWTRDHLVPEDQRDRVEAHAVSLYDRRARRLGWGPRRGRTETGETALLRANLLGFLAGTGRSARVRREAATRGRRYVAGGEIHADAVEPSLVPLVLSVAVQEGDAEFFDALSEMVLESDDALFRSRGIAALASTHDAELGARALALSLERRVRTNEALTPIWIQLRTPERRGAAWDWFREHFDEVFERVATTRAGYAPLAATGFCSEERAAEVQAFFGERIEALPGGPRNLASALEQIRLCAARVEAQRPSAIAFYASRRP